MGIVRVCQIGAGAHAGSHAESLKRYAEDNPGRIEVSVVCDLDVEKAKSFAEKHGFRNYCGSIKSAFSMQGLEINAVVSVLPQNILLPVVKELLTYGLPLLIEKPLGNNMNDADMIRGEIVKTGQKRNVMVSFNRRFDSAIKTAKEWMADKSPIRYVHGRMIRFERIETDFVWGTGIHIIDALNYLAGPLSLKKVINPGKKDDCWRVALLEGKDRADTFVEILPTSGPWEEEITISGDEWRCRVSTGMIEPWKCEGFIHGQLVLKSEGSNDEPAFIRNGSFAETCAFIDAVISGYEMSPNIDEAMESSRIAGAMQWR